MLVIVESEFDRLAVKDAQMRLSNQLKGTTGARSPKCSHLASTGLSGHVQDLHHLVA